MLNRRQFVESLTATLALTMLSAKKIWAHGCRDESMLDLAEAVRFSEQNPPELGDSKLFIVADLSDYTRATPEALVFLAQYAHESCSLVNVGLNKLDQSNARALVDWDAFCCFTRLESLDAEVAAILSDGNNALIFENLRVVSSAVAKELAKLNAILDLSLDSISLDVAHELIKHPHELGLELKMPPSDQLLNALCNHSGYRLRVTWERSVGSAPCCFLSPNDNKKVFVLPRFYKGAGQWFENVYIGDSDFYPDTLVSHDGIIEIL